MNVYFLVFALSLALGLLLTVLVRWAGRRLQILDLPDGFRKVQGQPTPRIGGLAIFVAFFGSLCVASLLQKSKGLAQCLNADDFLPLLGGATAVLIIGLWDDVRGLRARWKFLLLTLVAAAMYGAGYRIGVVSNPFGGAISLGFWVPLVTLFWFLGCMNAMNFIDGLDGLASGVTAFAAITIFVTSVLFDNGNVAISSLALTGAVLGFLVFNFHPASIFLGDSGSYLLGFLVACLGLRGAQKANTVVALLIPVIALGVPVLDTALAIVRRWSRALPLSAGDRQHIHHKLLKAGLTHRQTVLAMYAACVVLAGFAVLLTAVRDLQAAGVLVVLGLAAALAVRVIGGQEIGLATKRLTGGLKRRKIGAECRTAGYEAAERMQQADTMPAVWDAFAEAADAMELDCANLTVSLGLPDVSPGESTCSFQWRPTGSACKKDETSILWSATLPLLTDGKRFGALEVGIATDGNPLARELPEMLGLLATALADNVRRVEPSPHARPLSASRSGLTSL